MRRIDLKHYLDGVSHVDVEERMLKFKAFVARKQGANKDISNYTLSELLWWNTPDPIVHCFDPTLDLPPETDQIARTQKLVDIAESFGENDLRRCLPDLIAEWKEVRGWALRPTDIPMGARHKTFTNCTFTEGSWLSLSGSRFNNCTLLGSKPNLMTGCTFWDCFDENGKPPTQWLVSSARDDNKVYYTLGKVDTADLADIGAIIVTSTSPHSPVAR